MLRLSIVIPAYNEEKRIGKMLKAYTYFFNKQVPNHEIIVALNGCKDNTLKVVKSFSSKRLRYINLKESGKGGAIIEGFKHAKGELIGFVDADLSTSPSDFNELVEKIDDYGGIVASRWIKGAKIDIKQSLMRRFFSRGFNILVRTLFGIHIKDTQCGAKLFRKKVLDKILPNLGTSNWAFDIDLLYHVKKNNFKLKEIPTVWTEHGESHLKLGKTIPQMFLSVIRLRLVYSPFKFIVKFYDKVVHHET